MSNLLGEKCLKINIQSFNIQSFFCYFPACNNRKYREVAEWSKAHAWKVCIRQKRIEGSNPFLSAKVKEIFTFILGMKIVVKRISNYSLSVFDFYLLIAIFLYL